MPNLESPRSPDAHGASPFDRTKSPSSCAGDDLAAAWNAFVASRPPDTQRVMNALAELLITAAGSKQVSVGHGGMELSSGEKGMENLAGPSLALSRRQSAPSRVSGAKEVVLRPTTVPVGAQLAQAGKLSKNFFVSATRVFNPQVDGYVSHPALSRTYVDRGYTFAYPEGALLPRGASVTPPAEGPRPQVFQIVREEKGFYGRLWIVQAVDSHGQPIQSLPRIGVAIGTRAPYSVPYLFHVEERPT